jgi:hypothetical protein
MFLPGINANIGADGRLASSNQTDILTNFKTFMSNVNSLQDSPGVIVLASQGRKAPLVGGPANKAVTSVRLGNVYDTQRRRRNQLVEVYQTQPLFGI